MQNEYEIIPHKKIKHINILMTNIKYRAHHFHSDLELFCVIKSGAKVKVGDKTYELEKGSILLINSDEIHEIDAQQEAVCALVIQLSNHFLREYYNKFRATIFSENDLNKVLSSEDLALLWKLILEISKEYINEVDFFELKTVCQLGKILQVLLKNVPNVALSEKDYHWQKKITTRMNNIVSYIDDNYSMKIKLSDIAKMENISTTYLSHFFSQNFGVTFQQYLTNVRFEHALRLISNKTYTIFDVTFNSGFSDPKYLTEVFKQRYNCTPIEYRNSISKSESNSQQNFNVDYLEYYFGKEKSIEILENFEKN